jgi:hypothetical protein
MGGRFFPCLAGWKIARIGNIVPKKAICPYKKEKLSKIDGGGRHFRAIQPTPRKIPPCVGGVPPPR